MKCDFNFDTNTAPYSFAPKFGQQVASKVRHQRYFLSPGQTDSQVVAS